MRWSRDVVGSLQRPLRRCKVINDFYTNISGKSEPIMSRKGLRKSVLSVVGVVCVQSYTSQSFEGILFYRVCEHVVQWFMKKDGH
jgi:hypothetical protein